MEVEIVAIGDSNEILKMIEDYVYVEKDGLFLISIPKNLVKYTLSQFKNSNIEAIEYAQYTQIINSKQMENNLKKITNNEYYNWFNSGVEYFYTIAGNAFEMHSIDKKNIKTVCNAEPIAKCFMSNDGLIYGFIRGQTISFHMGNSLELIWDLKLDKAPCKIEYSRNNQFVSITLPESILVYNLFKCKFICEFQAIDSVFVNESLYLSQFDKLVDLTEVSSDLDLLTSEIMNINLLSNTSTSSKGLSCKFFDGDKSVQFIDGTLQKLIFNDGIEISKNHSNVTKIDFTFTENRLFALLVKVPGKTEHYSIESYMKGEFTSNLFDSPVTQLAASDNFLVVQMKNHDVNFLIKEKNTFRCVNTIRKKNTVMLSVNSYICVLYDSNLETVEFYDKNEIRATFTHPGCTNIKWAHSGLYVSTFSNNLNTGSLVQIFDCNAKLMYKKVVNSLREFSWRGFPVVPEEAKKDILIEHSIDEIEEAIDEDVLNRNILKKKWIEYLQSKMIKIN